MVVFVVTTVPTAAAAAAAAAAAVTAAIATTTATTSIVDTAAVAAAAALAVVTTAMDGGTLRVCGVQLRDLHTHTKNHRHSAHGESESFRYLKATNYKKEAGQGQTNTPHPCVQD